MSANPNLEIYSKKIRQFENAYGTGVLSDMIRFTNGRAEVLENDVQKLEIDAQTYQEQLNLFSQQSVEEFKKVWKKLKEIENRIPGPVVTPPPPPPPPQPTKPDTDVDKEPEPIQKPIKTASKK